MSEEPNYKEIKNLNIYHLEVTKAISFIFILAFSFVTAMSPIGLLESFGDDAVAAFFIMIILLFGSIAVFLTSTIALANVKKD
ncbi:hypothetical protein [Cytobacillus sp. IB215665]|uniref:hypothetical protein n=1 Tax=Cytobacillus sp. IB215665 TaxID=3097357 RepID=UPI002A0F4CA3|nr:hypothetical protein [Cytobacillus sp. IB215665]MDX8367735.1 hypothetical protein [Cytobacillus sp. IB215665]